MKRFDKYSTAKVKRSTFQQLPKGAYVIKILSVKEEQNNSGNGSHLKLAFDISEGEYTDFYKKMFDQNTNEDKKWPMDAVYNMSVPDDNSPQWMIDNFRTFTDALEESNQGYHFDWDERKWKGLKIGALFCIEQSEYNGNVYDHTRPKWFRPAEDIRQNKYGKLPRDKMVKASGGSSVGVDSDGFMTVPATTEDELPF